MLHFTHPVALLAGLWKKTTDGKDVGKKVFHLPTEEAHLATFKNKYDRTQKQLQTIAAMDDLLSGLLCNNSWKQYMLVGFNSTTASVPSFAKVILQ